MKIAILLSRSDIEQKLRQFLGVQNIIWLGDGIEGDDTDGHIDDLSRFVDRTTILTVIEKNPEDPNHDALRKNLSLLQQMRLEDGSAPKVVTLPMPSRIDRENLRLPASYANFYIANQCVLLPVYSDPNDAEALQILKSVFSSRDIVPIDCRELIWGLGAFHCLTQQQPS